MQTDKGDIIEPIAGLITTNLKIITERGGDFLQISFIFVFVLKYHISFPVIQEN